MAKILLRADVHCHPHSGSSRRAVECLEAYRWSYEVALARGCQAVVDLGDVFHERSHIDTWTYSETYETSKSFKDKGIGTVFILGNHDMYFRDSSSHNAIQAFEAMFRVVSSPETIDLFGRKFDCFPYVEKNPQRAMAEAFPAGSRSSILLFHAAFDEAIMSSASGMRRRAGVTPSKHEMHEEEVPESIGVDGLDGWKFAWGGHYHVPQVFCDKGCHAEYVGSIMQHNRSETGEKKRVVILDTETLVAEDVYNDVSPYFLKIDGDSEVPEDVDVSRARVYVYTADYGSPSVQAACRSLRQRGAIQVLTDTKSSVDVIDTEVQRRGIHGAAEMIRGDGAAMIRRYVKLQAPADLDTDRLVAMGHRILRTADTGMFED